ncbi:SulP family inorganic anion transporter [Cognatishimia sp. F0-27]|uniref:SulP family inorganic anion transporter n=1 Tax=Cognatishimia sp. F0-27 TaxID=2816855 RepID=UPI001D0C20A1|nr:SulP family inorganic anion transporter [Cognatishimia sp. F0-27]
MSDAGAKPGLKTLVPDLRAGFTVALVSIPEGMAYALVAGVNPVYGLYTGMVTTIVAAATGSTSRLIVTLTNALALVAGDTLADLSGDVDPITALFTLTFMVGVMMALLGALRLGSVIRFVSKEVMTGFIFVTALLIVLGQLRHLVGYSSELDSNRLVKAADILWHWPLWDWPTALAGMLSIAALLALKRSPARGFADFLVIVFAATLVWAVGLQSVEIAADIATVPSGASALPTPVLPDLTLIPLLLGGALAATVVGLSESSGVGAAYPNTNGTRTNMSRDFLGQGLGNIAGAFFQAMPAGGSLSRTGINASGGAQTRVAGIASGVMLALILVVAGSLANLIPLTGLAALLIVIGVEVMWKEGRALVRAWSVSRLSTAMAAVTVLVGLFVDLTAAIFAGVFLSLLLYAIKAAQEGRLVEIVRTPEGTWEETATIAPLKPGDVRVFELDGPLYFASVYDFDRLLPEPGTTQGATLILRVRDRSFESLTGLDWLEGYARAVKEARGQLVLTEVAPPAMEILGSKGLVPEVLRAYPAETVRFLATEKALIDTQKATGTPSPDTRMERTT